MPNLKKQKDENVIFRRVGGRVIPIRVKKDHRPKKQRSGSITPGTDKALKQALGGSALFSAGLGVAGLGAAINRRMAALGFKTMKQGMRRATESQRAFAKIRKLPRRGEQLGFAFAQPRATASSAKAQLKKSARLFKTGRAVGAASFATGAILASIGASEAIEAFTDKKNPRVADFIGGAIGAAATAGVVDYALGARKSKVVRTSVQTLRSVLKKGR